MTDEQITKALECCGKEKHTDCNRCILRELPLNECTTTVSQEALDLINSQKSTIDELTKAYKTLKSEKEAEIERLKARNDELNALNKTASVEAIKEFAEEVNLIVEELVDIMFDGNEAKCKISNCHKHSSIPCESPNCIEENKAYWKMRILNLAKEMEGESE